MQGILSLAALHLAYLHPAQKQRLILGAAHYHNETLQGFREGIDRMGDDNGDALFACASLNIIYVFGMFGKLNDARDGDPSPAARKSHILGAEWIPMIRGVEAVLHPVYDRVRLGPLRSMLDIGNWDELDPDRNAPPEDEFFLRIRAIWSQSVDAEVYDTSLYILRKSYMYTKQFDSREGERLDTGWGFNRGWSGPLLWLHFTPEQYFKLLHQRQPAALVIFAYFGALFHSLEKYWFMEGWGRSIVEVVDELLGSYWIPWMGWPKEIVESGL